MLQLLAGHHVLISGNFKAALVAYFRCYQMDPTMPIISLCIGMATKVLIHSNSLTNLLTQTHTAKACAYLNQSTVRTAPDRNLYIVQAFTYFFKYAKLRNWDQEATFNVARAFHHLGMFTWAITMYEKVLAKSTELRAQGKDTPGSDLSTEAAYNLSRIYAHTNPALAKKILREYVVVR